MLYGNPRGGLRLRLKKTHRGTKSQQVSNLPGRMQGYRGGMGIGKPMRNVKDIIAEACTALEKFCKGTKQSLGKHFLLLSDSPCSRQAREALVHLSSTRTNNADKYLLLWHYKMPATEVGRGTWDFSLGSSGIPFPKFKMGRNHHTKHIGPPPTNDLQSSYVPNQQLKCSSTVLFIQPYCPGAEEARRKRTDKIWDTENHHTLLNLGQHIYLSVDRKWSDWLSWQRRCGTSDKKRNLVLNPKL